MKQSLSASMISMFLLFQFRHSQAQTVSCDNLVETSPGVAAGSTNQFDLFIGAGEPTDLSLETCGDSTVPNTVVVLDSNGVSILADCGSFDPSSPDCLDNTCFFSVPTDNTGYFIDVTNDAATAGVLTATLVCGVTAPPTTTSATTTSLASTAELTTTADLTTTPAATTTMELSTTDSDSDSDSSDSAVNVTGSSESDDSESLSDLGSASDESSGSGSGDDLLEPDSAEDGAGRSDVFAGGARKDMQNENNVWKWLWAVVALFAAVNVGICYGLYKNSKMKAQVSFDPLEEEALSTRKDSEMPSMTDMPATANML